MLPSTFVKFGKCIGSIASGIAANLEDKLFQFYYTVPFYFVGGRWRWEEASGIIVFNHHKHLNVEITALD